VFFGQLTSAFHFQTSIKFFLALELTAVLRRVASYGLLMKCLVVRFPNLLKLANLFGSRARIEVACENLEAGKDFRFPITNRPASN
jgi:hypothetical protein